MIAVITADLIDSSSYPPEFLELVLETLQKEFDNFAENFSEEKSNFKIYRGDSFQGIITNPENALLFSLFLKTALNKLESKDSSAIKADLRIAIGIGGYDLKRDEISESNGEAFQLSGRTLDDMKSNGRKLMLKTPNIDLNREFYTSLALFDFIADRWSTASAEVIYYLLQGYKEKEIAKIVGISQSAINQRKKIAAWDPISALLKRYEEKISATFKEN
ncbi:SatD family protein [Zunongwangia endophytica]|uniref:SatD family protein n=1 Tax=Zunongwangia endophytica TaxID=1808945 RepID=A0ABV8HHA0_9FLAO|nr:SatD family protein [Zunongwangia endophytica]MDN3594099.1 SatD family protein [Zunongwangia endophytica]